METTKICLNLHEKYAKTWGAWEVAREIYCNALDASPDGFHGDTTGPNDLTITTPTAPSIAEMLIIGCGSKGIGDDTIGQFGEGMKLAALAATRSGGSMTLIGPGYHITFALEEFYGQQVLYATVQPTPVMQEGLSCVVHMDGIGRALEGKFLTDRSQRFFLGAKGDPPKLFCKGVYICDMPDNSVYSYNLNDVTINRDRSVVCMSTVKRSIDSMFQAAPTLEFGRAMLENPTSYEGTTIAGYLACGINEAAQGAVREAFFAVHGDRAVHVDSLEEAVAVRKLGYTAVMLPAILSALAKKCAIRSTTDVLPPARELKICDWQSEWDKYVPELKMLSQIVGVESSLKVFTGDPMLLGRAVCEDELVMLNESLMTDDMRYERIHTYLHELAHLKSRANDGSVEFEYAMGVMMTTFALEVIAHRNAGAWVQI